MNPEVQRHGFDFENWVRETFFGGYRGGYGQDWDVPSEANCCNSVPETYINQPVSIKTAKYGSPIGLGDILRQRGIKSPFIMIAGFWEQRSADEKWIVDIGCAKFSAETWNHLWGGIELQYIKELDRMVKDLSQHYNSVRQYAQNWKREALRKYPNTTIVINPKIDSRSQRRVQCSLPFSKFWQQVGRDPARFDKPCLFGIPFINPIRSAARSFNQKESPDTQ